MGITETTIIKLPEKVKLDVSETKMYSESFESIKLISKMDFLGGTVPCQCRGHGLDPWSRKIPHASEQLCLSGLTREPMLCNKRSHHKTLHSKEE